LSVDLGEMFVFDSACGLPQEAGVWLFSPTNRLARSY
jgi:hypothetical protein